MTKGMEAYEYGQVTLVLDMMNAEDSKAIVSRIEGLLTVLASKERLGWTWFEPMTIPDPEYDNS